MSALAITAVNATALYIFGKNPKMKTPQYLYRINLAVADFMLGIFTFIPSIYFATERFNKIATVSGKYISLTNQTTLTLEEVGYFLISTGFVSWLSFLVSISTLIAASFDRIFATVFPARYVKRDNCYVTIGVCVIVWVFAISNLVAGFVTSPISGITSPYFMMNDEKTSRLHTLVLNFVSLGFMLANSLVVLMVMYFHNRFVSCSFFIKILTILQYLDLT